MSSIYRILLPGKLICKLLRRHVWRRAHKDEQEGRKYCRRCGQPRAINTRKPKEPQT